MAIKCISVSAQGKKREFGMSDRFTGQEQGREAGFVVQESLQPQGPW